MPFVLAKTTGKHWPGSKRLLSIGFLPRKIDINESTIKDVGNTVVPAGKGTFNMAMNGQTMNDNMVYTEVYLKNNDQWKLIARQAVQKN